jgi:hypothetical protein
MLIDSGNEFGDLKRNSLLGRTGKILGEQGLYQKEHTETYIIWLGKLGMSKLFRTKEALTLAQLARALELRACGDRRVS